MEMREVRDGDPALTPALRMAMEGRHLLEAMAPQDIPIVLDETGKRTTSMQLADLLQKMDVEERRRPCFIVGGAWGLDAAVAQRAVLTLRLSDMTFPHELARVVLLEQLYRAECILHKVPYHH